MNKEEFSKVLNREKYSYEIQGDKLVVTHEWTVYLNSLTSLPPGVEFKNKGDVVLFSLTYLPPDVVFKNKGDVYLDHLTSISPGVEFNNEGGVDLDSLTGDWFSAWEGNIEGIDSKRLLNKMIKDGVFER